MKKLFLFSLFFLYVSAFSPPVIRNIQSSSGWSPPDQGIGVSPNRIVSCVNGNCVLYSKDDYKLLVSTSLNNIFSTVRVGSTFDPRVFYDFHSQRLLIISTTGARLPGSGLLLAISKTNEPNTFSLSDWNTFFFKSSDSDAVWADYPSVGFDKYNYYISVNMYTGTGKQGVLDTNPRLFIVDKVSLLQNSLNFKVHKIPGAYTMVTASPLDQSNHDYIYVLTRSGSSIKILQFTGISNFNQTSFSSYTIFPSLSAFPASYPNQKGGTATINSGDARYQSAVFHNNFVWLTFSAANKLNGPPTVFWFQINPLDKKIHNSGSFSHPESDIGGAFFYPALITDSSGNANLIFNGVSSNEFVSIYTSAVCLNGTVISPIKIAEGMDYFFSNRYGDYTGISRDPLNNNLIWAGLELPILSNQWKISSVLFKSLCDPSDDPEHIDCSFDCGKNGICNLLTGSCVCNSGWSGPDCLICDEKFYGPTCQSCPYCNDDKFVEAWNHGYCNDGLNGDGSCICLGVWLGDSCEFCPDGYYNYFDRTCRICPKCVNGSCDQSSGNCICNSGWSGTLCSSCADGFFGPNCLPCPDCGNHGDCVNGDCVCDPHWIGTTCNECSQGYFLPNCTACPDCGEHGDCINGDCVCEYGWSGPLCDHCNPDEEVCDVCNCGPNGKCIDPVSGKCECKLGWALPNCTSCDNNYYLENDQCLICPDCGEHGNCIGGECVCDPGWTSPSFIHDKFYFRSNQKVSMQNPNGFCSICKTGFFFDGSDCLKCPDCVSGVCDEKGRCSCHTGWAGALCEECDTDFFGPACSPCPDCGKNGICNQTKTGNGHCLCDFNWSGINCEECAKDFFGLNCEPCPNCGESKSRGSCIDGQCVCNDPWIGLNCEECKPGFFGSNCKSCSECHYGICENSLCNCLSGWQGLSCDFCFDDSACLNGGLCRDSVCKCSIGWEGPDCTTCSENNTSPSCFNCFESSCPCNNHGVCIQSSRLDVGKCDCDTGWFGQNCENCSEENTSIDCPWINCGVHGRNILPNKCECDYGFSGRNCDICIEHISNLACFD